MEGAGSGLQALGASRMGTRRPTAGRSPIPREGTGSALPAPFPVAAREQSDLRGRPVSPASPPARSLSFHGHEERGPLCPRRHLLQEASSPERPQLCPRSRPCRGGGRGAASLGALLPTGSANSVPGASYRKLHLGAVSRTLVANASLPVTK